MKIQPVVINSFRAYPQFSKQNIQSDAQYDVGLPDFNTAQAILARNNITFRNLDKPVEITNLYNKKTEGKDHLNLPNIHVYEYPDTNLMMILDIAEEIDYPLVKMELENQGKKNFNPILSAIIKNIKDKQFKTYINKNAVFNMEDDLISYYAKDYSSIQNLSKMHKLVFNNNFTEENLQEAKAQLLQCYYSREYQERNIDLKYFYDNKLFKSDGEFLKDIEAVTLDDITRYYDNYLSNISGTLTIIVPKDFYESNKNFIFKSSIENIPVIIPKKMENNNSSSFIPNKNLQVLKGFDDYTPISLSYKISLADDKDLIIRDLVEMLLEKDYTMMLKYYDTPLNIKNNDNTNSYIYEKVYIHAPNNNSSNWQEKLEKFESNIDKICNSDISDELKTLKEIYKDNLKYDLTENIKSFSRKINVLDLDSMFNIYEIIDKIDEEDIKAYLKKYFINQKPIVHLNNSMTTGGYCD